MRYSSAILVAASMLVGATAVRADVGACRLFAPRHCAPVIKPRSVRRVMPTYPFEARRRHIEGNVKVRVQIDRHGNVAAADAETVNAFLAAAAVDAARQWRFVPLVVVGHVTECTVTIEFHFRLDGGVDAAVA